METNKTIIVSIGEKKVGELVLSAEKRVCFQYDQNWIKNGYSISPFSLPLRDDVFYSTKPYYDGLFGVFADSLPDAWGKIWLNLIWKRI